MTGAPSSKSYLEPAPGSLHPAVTTAARPDLSGDRLIHYAPHSLRAPHTEAGDLTWGAGSRGEAGGAAPAGRCAGGSPAPPGGPGPPGPQRLAGVPRPSSVPALSTITSSVPLLSTRPSSALSQSPGASSTSGVNLATAALLPYSRPAPCPVNPEMFLAGYLQRASLYHYLMHALHNSSCRIQIYRYDGKITTSLLCVWVITLRLE